MKYDERQKKLALLKLRTHSNNIFGQTSAKQEPVYGFKETHVRSPMSRAKFVSENFMIVESKMNDPDFDLIE